MSKKPPDGESMRRMVVPASGKAERGEELTEKESIIFQRENSIGGCHACSP